MCGQVASNRGTFQKRDSKGRNQSGYEGVHRDGNRWRAKITRNGVETCLGTYDNEFNAAIVYQVADGEYTKLGLTSSRAGRRKKDTCTNRQPATHHPASPSVPEFFNFDGEQAHNLPPGDLSREQASPG